MEPSDAQLVADTIAGDQKAFPLLLERHLSAVYKFAYRFLRDPQDAEDIAQETFIRAWKHLKTFDASRNFKTWIFTIAKNAALDFIKSKKPLAFSRLAENDFELDALFALHLPTSETSESMVDQKILGADMKAMLQKLPPAYRTVLALRYNDNLKFREIAETLGEPIDTIKSRHRRGLLLLRKFFFA